MTNLLLTLQKLRRRLARDRPKPGSLAIRAVDAGSCNGCEHELNAAAAPHYDMQRLGLNVVASPRHADVLLVSGAVTSAMAEPLRRAYESMPEPKLVAALGDCALGRGLLGDPSQCGRGVASVLPVDVGIPGCPPAPDEIIDGLRQLRPGARRADGGPGSVADQFTPRT